MDSQATLLADANILANQVSNQSSFFSTILSKFNVLKNKINKKYLFVGIGITIAVIALVLYVIYRKNKKANQQLKCSIKNTNQKLNGPLKYKVNDDDEPYVISEESEPKNKPLKKNKSKLEPESEPEPEEIANLDLTKEEIDDIEEEINNDEE